MKSNIPTKDLTQQAKDYFKAKLQKDYKTTDDLIADPNVNKLVGECIEEANKKAVSRAHHIRKWRFVAVDFSLPGGEFTPTLKLKRKVAEKKYSELVE